MTTISILKCARERVKAGWCQGSGQILIDGKMHYCMSFATGFEPGHMQADDAIRKVIGERFIPGWNDSPKRTKRQVLAAFDKAIKMEEAKCKSKS